ncbi:hypothetical protein TSTA_002340 [Talaromyces stipitatus ATCC 10500]|uniref:Uncharacterized protein n=1 Tax=Talaromyces stipitatus (strain ATCC 10500 / CBS 375.48 / QM 6759 / NRRL 1006) TaxID=441959 RepID=B8MT71_TALSN|nr:uncharacterized protein TSTA_002340 [Talaromyces stipitatus ATCC 10500]EED12168.1 hypothetical protein TSTA_002340 [Talaromyces stipitatus ATCC 10500]
MHLVGKHCYICKVCAWLKCEETLSSQDSSNWQCPDCKHGTQLLADMDVDSSSVISFNFNDPKDSTTKEPAVKGISQTSDSAIKSSEATPKATTSTTPKRHRTSKPPSPPQVIIDSPKKNSASGSPIKRRKKSSKSSQKQRQNSATQTDVPDEMRMSTSEHPTDDLEPAIKTLKTHIANLHILRTRNTELDEEVKALKEKSNTQEQTAWELKEYNENLELQVEKLKTERADLCDKLREIRRLSGFDILQIET